MRLMSGSKIRYGLAFSSALLSAAAAGEAQTQPRAATPTSKQVAPPTTAVSASADVPSRELLDRYCVTCHNERLKTGGVVLERLELDAVEKHAPVLEKVIKKLRSGQMPPGGRPAPDAATRTSFIRSLETALDRSASRAPNPGRVASRRLNRTEYVNVVKDLIDLDVDGAALLPSDMAGHGFDNNADVLSITPALMSRYQAAATKVARAAMSSPENRPAQQMYSLGIEDQSARMSEDMPFATHGGLAVRHIFPLDGEYEFVIRMKGNDSGGGGVVGIQDEHEIELRVDHELLKKFAVGGKFKGADPGTLIPIPDDDIEGKRLHEYFITADKDLKLRVSVKAGTRLVAVTFHESAPTPLAGSYGRPGIDKVLIAGPFKGTVPIETPSRQRILTCKPAADVTDEACARRILRTLARRAYRRPVTTRDIEGLMAVYREGRRERDFEGGIERSLEALLSMPEFLMRVEREPQAVTAGTYRLNDLELASRLSFFLWRSVPDEALLTVAEKGQLRSETVLVQQVRRMLADRRATRFMNDFVGQWLQVRNLLSHQPDPELFPGFTDTLRRAMVRETELFFESQVRDDRPIPELLRAEYSYLNEQLARHYRVPGVYGSRFRRVKWPDDRRRGLLGQGSVLTVSSYANRTSVVLRGKWVLENLLGSPPPAPPANVPPLKPSDAAKPTSLRERMEQHRANPVCASCHTRMDPLGFTLENFDAIGRWRETDGGAKIDSSVMWDESPVSSPRMFNEAILARDALVRTVTEKLLIFALGRGVEYYDAPTIRQLVRDVERDGGKWSSLVLGIVKSAPFQMRRVHVPDATTQVARTGQVQ